MAPCQIGRRVCSPATVVLTSRACRACPSGTMAGSARRPAAVRRSTMQRTGRIATGELHRIGTPWLALRWLEFIRRLSALSLSTTGSTTACWSSLSGPISTNGPVLQSLPSHTRKVTGSIPVGTTTKTAARHRFSPNPVRSWAIRGLSHRVCCVCREAPAKVWLLVP